MAFEVLNDGVIFSMLSKGRGLEIFTVDDLRYIELSRAEF